MNPVNLVCTNTTRFIIPMLVSNNNYTKILNKTFIDSYSFDYYEPNYDNKIIIVQNTNLLPDINRIPISTYQRQNHYCFVYEVPEEFKKDYNTIMKGKDNNLSDHYYNRLLNFWDEEKFLTKIKYNPIREMYRVT